MKAILHLNIFCTHRQGLWKAMVVQGRMDACPVFVEIFHLRFTEEILYWDLRALTPCHNNQTNFQSISTRVEKYIK